MEFESEVDEKTDAKTIMQASFEVNGESKTMQADSEDNAQTDQGRRRSCSATNGWLQYSSSPWSLQFLPWSSSLWYSLRPASCGQSRLTVELRCVSLSKTLAQLLSAPHIHQLIPTDVG